MTAVIIELVDAHASDASTLLVLVPRALVVALASLVGRFAITAVAVCGNGVTTINGNKLHQRVA